MSAYETFQIVVVMVTAVVWGLVTLSRRRPDVAWLEPWRTAFPRPTEAQRQRMRRRASAYAGAELILLGVVIPIGYVALTVMMFNDFTPGWLIAVAASSLLCIGLGVTALVQSRR